MPDSDDDRELDDYREIAESEVKAFEPDEAVESEPDPDDAPVVEPPDVQARALIELAQVEAVLNKRWPETKIAPSLDRIAALLSMMGDPHTAYPLVQVAGTNGKGSVARMIDALMTRMGVRVGRYTSPHLNVVTERIAVDGGPISPSSYVDTYRDVAPFVELVDKAQPEGSPLMTKFEVLTAMAFAAFADAPVEVGVLETGMGGRWDATNVGSAQVAAITPISMDHADHLGDTLPKIAAEKAGIIKAGSVAVIAEQHPDVQKVLLERAVELDAAVARAGSEFGVLSREVAVGGQRLTLQGLGGVYEDIYLPHHGAHQAANAALALATVEAFFGAGKDRQLVVDPIREAFAEVELPGRLERVLAAPSVIVDAAHNPAGAAALASTLDTEFSFRRLVAVVAVLGDKDARGILDALEPVVDSVVLTRNSSPRCVAPDALAPVAVDVFGEDRVAIADSLENAVEEAVGLVEDTDGGSQSMAGGGVVITGSVVTAGDARAAFGKEPV